MPRPAAIVSLRPVRLEVCCLEIFRSRTRQRAKKALTYAVYLAVFYLSFAQSFTFPFKTSKPWESAGSKKRRHSSTAGASRQINNQRIFRIPATPPAEHSSRCEPHRIPTQRLRNTGHYPLQDIHSRFRV